MHSCVTSIQIPNYSDDSEIVHLWNTYPRTDRSVIADLCSPVLCMDNSEMANLCSAVLCNVLDGNHAVKTVTLEVSSGSLQIERVFYVLLSMKGLEELHCEVSSWDKVFSTTILALLRDSATLTVFDVIAPRIENAYSGLLVRALRANSTLRDLTVSSSDVAVEPELFVAFMSSTVTLKRLKVVKNRCAVEYDMLKWIFQGMLKNLTVSSLEARELCVHKANVKLGAKMLARNKVLRSFSLLHCSYVSFNMSREEITAARDSINASWIGALSKNNTLELMTLSVSIWSNEHWGHFFRFLSRHDSLKMVTVDVAKHERALLSDVVNEVREIRCQDKVSFMDSHGDNRFSLADWTNYSERRACRLAQDQCTARAVYEELSTYLPLTFLRLQMEWDKELGWLLVEFVLKMVTLKKLDLILTGRGETKLDDWWLALVQSLLHNRSIISPCGFTSTRTVYP
ncbi:hypothetical protein HPB51_012389 [Rhipicephalus microplus]|uniref:Uncharacterized protein n=1 Tax=Rhipicephalus microplus TaxID=6941 RepID=A0A9J6E9L2_RHIMP|nr:hypothetical protein HPB51_012389 [Rhipicephalus microplus]